MNYPSEEQINKLLHDYYVGGVMVGTKELVLGTIELVKSLNPEPEKPEFDWPEEWVCACKDLNNKWTFFKHNSLSVDHEEWLINSGFNKYVEITNEILITHLNQLTAGKPWTECKVLRSEVIKC